MGDFNDLFGHIEKNIKKDSAASIHRAGDIHISSRIPFGIPTRIPELDLNLGRPGWPAGRVIELYGFQYTGKSSAAFHALSQVQRMGGSGLFIDTEHVWDESRAIDLGVNVENMGISRADSIEAAFRIVQAAIEGIRKTQYNKPFIFIIDSLTGAPTEYQKEQELGAEPRLGMDARAIRGGLRVIVSDLAKTKALLFLVNHAIEKAGVSFGKKSQAAGGHAAKFFSSVRVEFQRMKDFTKGMGDDKIRLGQVIKVNVEKSKINKLEKPSFDINLLDDSGFDIVDSLLKAMVKVGMIEKPNTKTFRYGEHEFSRSGWKDEMVLTLGGVDKIYKEFLDFAISTGHIKAWTT